MSYTCRLLILLCVCLPLLSKGQDTDSLRSYHAKGILILSYRHTTISTSCLLNATDWRLDPLQHNPDRNLAELLQQQTGMFIKSYGPGVLASPSLRGGNASHLQVVWNGMPINNLMHGQSDLNLFPSEMADEAHVECGGSSKSGGSGAIAGTLSLNQKTAFNTGITAGISSGIGSFGHYRNTVSAGYGKDKWYFSAKAWQHQADNNFIYEIPDAPIRTRYRQQDARTEGIGWTSHAGLKIGRTGLLTWHHWQQAYSREIPPVISQPTSSARQQDQQIKSVFNWTSGGASVYWKGMAGYSYDYLRFTDSLAGLNSISKIHQWIQQVEGEYRLNSYHTFSVSMWGSQAFADQVAYSITPRQMRLALIPAYRFEKGRIKLWLNGRQEILQQNKRWQSISPLGEIKSTIHIHKELNWKVNLSSVSRIPSFNDLYWMPGGNPDLLPEQGYHAETGFSRAEKSLGTLPLNLSFNTEVYYGRLNNRILWIPGNTYWRAVNIGSVITTGMEAELELSKPYPNGKTWWRFRYLYNQTHTQQQPERQLIYVPANSAGAGLGFQFKSWKAQTWYSYTGFVFTATDHSAWLPAWGTLDIKLEKKLQLKKGIVRIYLEARNILNVSYQVMENRPMPGRNYFAGIQWNFASHKHK